MPAGRQVNHAVATLHDGHPASPPAACHIIAERSRLAWCSGKSRGSLGEVLTSNISPMAARSGGAGWDKVGGVKRSGGRSSQQGEPLARPQCCACRQGQLEDGAEDEAPPAHNYPALLHGAAAPQWRRLAPTPPSGSLLLITPTPPVVQCGAACRRAVVPTSGPRYMLLSTESGAVCAARVQQQVAMSGCAPAARPWPGWGLARPWAAEHNKWVITTGPWTGRDGQGTPGGASAACYVVFQCPWLHTSAQPSTHQRTTASQVQGHPPPGR